MAAGCGKRAYLADSAPLGRSPIIGTAQLYCSVNTPHVLALRWKEVYLGVKSYCFGHVLPSRWGGVLDLLESHQINFGISSTTSRLTLGNTSLALIKQRSVSPSELVRPLGCSRRATPVFYSLLFAGEMLIEGGVGGD